jgi:hypothetical protein
MPETRKFIRTEIYFLTVLEAEKFQIKAAINLLSGEGPISVSKMAPCPCILWKRGNCVLTWQKIGQKGPNFIGHTLL